MVRASYFSITEWLLIIVMALFGALLNVYLPIKAMTKALGIPGPCAGMALLGGFIFVLWVHLSLLLTGKRWSGLATAILIACICLFFQPWYGITSPSWFSVYALISLSALGISVELLRKGKILGGGVGNLLCLVINWLAIGFHAHTWAEAKFVPLLLAASFISGILGSLIARGIAKFLGRGGEE